MKLNELHGGEVEWAVSERYNIPISEIISFASTVSPIIPTSIVSLARKFDKLYLYPARDHTKLKEIIARHQELNAGRMILGCGSTEIIHLIAQLIAPAEAIIPVPSYGEYEAAVLKHGGKPVFVGPADNFGLDVEAIGGAISARTKAIFICNPNNPTGKLYDKRDLEELAKIAEERDLVLVVDEAYLAFAPDSKKYSMTSFIRSYPILVLNSLSKLFGVPSLRLGWGMGSSTLVNQLENLKIPWTISNLAVWAAEELLSDSSHQKQVRSLISSQRSELKTQFDEIKWLKAYPSDCNFFLLQILDNRITATDVFEGLVKKGIVVRDCSSMRTLGNRFFRITIRTPGDNKKLISSLTEKFAPTPTLHY